MKPTSRLTAADTRRTTTDSITTRSINVLARLQSRTLLVSFDVLKVGCPSLQIRKHIPGLQVSDIETSDLRKRSTFVGADERSYGRDSGKSGGEMHRRQGLELLLPSEATETSE
jgi:hypothetical protein